MKRKRINPSTMQVYSFYILKKCAPTTVAAKPKAPARMGCIKLVMVMFCNVIIKI